jgi:type II secretory pathway component PulM
MSIKQNFNEFALRIQDSLSGLSDRDRKLLFGMVGSVLIGIVGGGIFWLNASLQNLESSVTYREQTLVNAQLIAMDYANNVETAEQIANNLEKHRNTNLSAFLEKSAASVGLQDHIDSVKEQSSAINGDLEEKLFSAEFSNLSLEDAANFLYEIESSGYPLVVQSARFKTRKRSGERVLKLTLAIAAYKLTTPAPGGEG